MNDQEKNSQATTSRVGIIQTVRTPLGFFTLGLLVVEAILGIVASLSEGTDRTFLIKGMLILIFVLIVLVAILAFFRPEALSGKRPSITNSPTIRELSNRHLYLAEITKQIDTAQKSVWLSVHTLNPSTTSPEVRELQEKLEQAVENKKEVRILAPSGAERVKAVRELSQLRGIPIKVLDYLGVEDLRYMIVDENLSIISLESSDDQGSSTAGAVINSEQLNRLLRGHFDEGWKQPSAMGYKTFLAFEVRRLLNPFQPPSRKAIADRLGIPIPEVDRVLRIQPAKVLFLVGRPCSGKTSAIRMITEYLNSIGYDNTEIAIYNDYRKLYEWFVQDTLQNNFEPGPRGGFRVKNFGILDDCLREINNSVVNDLTKMQFVIVEFSRSQYLSAMACFDDQILKSCIIYYLQTPLSTCIKRNEGRSHHDSDDTGFVPPDILESYYRNDDVDQLGEKFSDRLVEIDNKQDNIALLRDKITNDISKRIGSWLLESNSPS